METMYGRSRVYVKVLRLRVAFSYIASFSFTRKNYTTVKINPNPGLQFDWQAVRAASGDKWNEEEKTLTSLFEWFATDAWFPARRRHCVDTSS